MTTDRPQTKPSPLDTDRLRRTTYSRRRYLKNPTGVLPWLESEEPNGTSVTYIELPEKDDNGKLELQDLPLRLDFWNHSPTGFT